MDSTGPGKRPPRLQRGATESRRQQFLAQQKAQREHAELSRKMSEDEANSTPQPLPGLPTAGGHVKKKTGARTPTSRIGGASRPAVSVVTMELGKLPTLKPQQQPRRQGKISPLPTGSTEVEDSTPPPNRNSPPRATRLDFRTVPKKDPAEANYEPDLDLKPGMKQGYVARSTHGAFPFDLLQLILSYRCNNLNSALDMSCTCSRWFKLMMTHELWWEWLGKSRTCALGGKCERRTAPVIDIAVACQLPPLHTINLTDSSHPRSYTALHKAIDAGQLTNLRCLRLSKANEYLYKVKDVESLAKATPNLTTLILRRLARMSEAELANMIEGYWPLLSHIDLAAGTKEVMGPMTCAAIGRSFPLLETLQLSECRGLDTECVKLLLASPTRRLHTINVNFTSIDDDALQLIAQRCGSSLLRLQVDGCAMLTDSGVLTLFELLPYNQLEGFSASFCRKVTGSFVGTMVTRCSKSLRNFGLVTNSDKDPSLTILRDLLDRCVALEEVRVLDDEYKGSEGLQKLRSLLESRITVLAARV